MVHMQAGRPGTVLRGLGGHHWTFLVARSRYIRSFEVVITCAILTTDVECEVDVNARDKANPETIVF